MDIRRAVLFMGLAAGILGSRVAIAGTGDGDLSPELGVIPDTSEPFTFIDGASGYSEHNIGLGRAMALDVPSGLISVQIADGTYDLTVQEVVSSRVAAGGDPARIGAEMTYAYASGGALFAGLSDTTNDFSQYRNHCLEVGCTVGSTAMNGSQFDFWTMGPRQGNPPPPPPPEPPQTDKCLQAAIDTADAAMAQDAAQRTCSTSRGKSGALMCAGMAAYSGVRLYLATRSVQNCSSPPPPPPRQPRGSSFYGWGY